MKANKVTRIEHSSQFPNVEWHRMEWGGFVPKTCRVGYGARAIYTNGVIDFVSDRVSTTDCSEEDFNRLAKWVGDNKIFDLLQAKLDEHQITSDSDDYLVINDGDEFFVQASPNGSHGYLYLSAWVV